MITIKNLSKTYNERVILNINELIINNGEFFGLVGNNGAGKTTLLRILLDLIRVDKGDVHSDSYIVSESENWKIYTNSYLDEGFLIDFLSPEEFFYFIGQEYGYTKIDIDQKLVGFKDFFNNEILGQKKKFIRDFSKGNKQKIGIVSAILTEPKVLVFDEPFNSLDPTSQILLKRILVDYSKSTGATIIISSHDLNHVVEICGRIALIEKGIIIRDMKNDGKALDELENYFSTKETY